MLIYKGFIAHFDYDEETESFNGEVINAPDVIEFAGKDARSIKQDFYRAVDEYLALHKEQAGRAVTPFIAKFNLYLSPKQQQKIMSKARREAVSIEYWLNREFNHYLQSFEQDTSTNLNR